MWEFMDFLTALDSEPMSAAMRNSESEPACASVPGPFMGLLAGCRSLRACVHASAWAARGALRVQVCEQAEAVWLSGPPLQDTLRI